MRRKYRIISVAISICAATFAVAFAALRTSSSRSRVGPMNVTWGEIRNLDYWVRLCDQATRFVELNGVRYCDVTGQPPYCIYAAGANAIVFSVLPTDAPDDLIIVVYDIDSGNVRKINTHGVFGQLIARPPIRLLPNEDPSEDRIVSSSHKQIEFLAIRGDHRRRFVVDLQSLEITCMAD